MPLSLLAARRVTVATLIALACGLSIPAQAQGKLEARYGVSMTGITIGKAALSVDIGDGRYATSASGRASGLLSVLVNGEGTVAAQGAIKDGRAVPAAYTSAITRDDEKTELKMALDNGAVTNLTAETAAPAPDRVPLREAHRKGVIDPLSALLVPMTGAFDVLAADTCNRTLPIFDGRRRYDLKLSFKRMDQVKVERGYAGPVVVCSMVFQAQAGHRASSTLVKYLSEGRDMELWFAPIAGTRLIAPFRASVASMLGNVVVQATQFEVLSQTAAASRTTGQRP